MNSFTPCLVQYILILCLRMDASDIIGEAERGDLIEIKRTVKSAPYMVCFSINRTNEL